MNQTNGGIENEQETIVFVLKVSNANCETVLTVIKNNLTNIISHGKSGWRN